jgi:hypothetical protein
VAAKRLTDGGPGGSGAGVVNVSVSTMAIVTVLLRTVFRTSVVTVVADVGGGTLESRRIVEGTIGPTRGASPSGNLRFFLPTT